MPIYHAPLRDYQFLLEEWLNIYSYSALSTFQAINPELVNAMLEEGQRFCEEVILPLNQSGDAEGCCYKEGKVMLPKGFRDAYQLYVQGGWAAFTCDPHYGGQGLPEVVSMPFTEMVCSTNVSFGMIPGLTHGAYHAINRHANESLKKLYLPKIISGEWTGVMCLTEPQCGTDLGLIRTQATPQEDGSYALSGTKIFISAGEHDASENIIHLVLARLPGAPVGTKGISLFLVPKMLVKEDGQLAEKNNVQCTGIEHKMGIHASPTCVMQYDMAKGWLVGEANKGLKAMFTMMNEARIYVGIQGLGLAEIAYQNALAYAKERLQGRDLKAAVAPDKPADPILVHPDVRRMLLTMKSFIEGGRAMVLKTALQLDIAKHHPDAATREAADEYVHLLTPIVKAYLTDGGFEATNLGMQILGGYGYIRDYGMEQYVRDARIAQIYEGTNGIQALDLVGRKLSVHTGRYLRHFFHPVAEFIALHEKDSRMKEFTKPLGKVIDSLQKASLWIADNGLRDPNQAAAGSVEYLRLFALAVMAFHWAEMAHIALEKKETDINGFYASKIATARFFMQKIVPGHYSLLASIVNGAPSIMAKEIW